MSKHRGPSRRNVAGELVLYFLVFLIGLVVIWGLVRDHIDTTALVTLSSLAGGIAGLASKLGGGGSGKDGGEDE